MLEKGDVTCAAHSERECLGPGSEPVLPQRTIHTAHTHVPAPQKETIDIRIVCNSAYSKSMLHDNLAFRTTYGGRI